MAKLRRNSEDQFIRKSRRGNPLTICIVAICEVRSEYPKIIFCTDTLMESEIKYERGHKIRVLTDYCFCMFASEDVSKTELILSNIDDKIGERRPSVKDIAKIVSNACEQFWVEERERQILTPLNLTYKDLNSHTFPQDYRLSINERLLRYKPDFENDFLLFGFDDRTPRIFLINTFGQYTPENQQGYEAIGSGKMFALADLNKTSHFSYMKLSEAVFRVYSAKKAAESAAGVGLQTNLWIMDVPNKKVDTIPPLARMGETILESIDKLMMEMKENENKLIKKISNKLDSHLDRFTQLRRNTRNTRKPKRN